MGSIRSVYGMHLTRDRCPFPGMKDRRGPGPFLPQSRFSHPSRVLSGDKSGGGTEDGRRILALPPLPPALPRHRSPLLAEKHFPFQDSPIFFVLYFCVINPCGKTPVFRREMIVWLYILLVFDVSHDGFLRYHSCTPYIIGARPQCGQTTPQPIMALPKHMRSIPLHLVDDQLWGDGRGCQDGQVDVVRHDLHCLYPSVQLLRFLLEEFPRLGFQYLQMIMQAVDRMGR